MMKTFCAASRNKFREVPLEVSILVMLNFRSNPILHSIALLIMNIRDQSQRYSPGSDPSAISTDSESQVPVVSMADVHGLCDEIKSFRASELKGVSGEQETHHDVHSFEVSLLNCFGLNTLYLVSCSYSYFSIIIRDACSTWSCRSCG